jgi:hypothetical protein
MFSFSYTFSSFSLFFRFLYWIIICLNAYFINILFSHIFSVVPC